MSKSDKIRLLFDVNEELTATLGEYFYEVVPWTWVFKDWELIMSWFEYIHKQDVPYETVLDEQWKKIAPTISIPEPKYPVTLETPEGVYTFMPDGTKYLEENF